MHPADIGPRWTVHKDAPLSPPLVQRPHPPILVSAQSEQSLRWAAQHDIPFAQADQARHDQTLLSGGSKRARACAGAAALFNARDLCGRKRCVRSRRGAPLSAAILGFMEPLPQFTRLTSDARLLAYRELDDTLSLTDTGADTLADARTGKNGRHRLAGLLRQSVFGRLAGL